MPVNLDERLVNADWPKRTPDMPRWAEWVESLTPEQQRMLPAAYLPLEPITAAGHYDPNQPRDPGGEGGGRWIKAGTADAVADGGPFEVPDGVNFATTGYQSGPGQIWYRQNVTIFVEDAIPDGPGLVDKFDALLGRTPDALRRNVKAVNFLAGPNPHDSFWADKFERPGFQSGGSAYHARGEINFWNGKSPGEGLAWHEMGHLMHDGGPADDSRWLDAQSLDVPSGEATLARIKAAQPDLGSTEFFTEGNIYGQPTTTYIGNHGTFILGDHAVTDYGRENIREDWAESVELYIKDLKYGGLATVKEDGFLRRVYFEDIWPHRAVVLHEEIGL